MPEKKVTICLINPPSLCVEDDRVEPHLGLLYIAAMLKNHDFPDIAYYDMSGCHNEQMIKDAIKNIPIADIYGITALSLNYVNAIAVIKYIREYNKTAYVIIGGVHATAFPLLVFKESGADIVITGFGEDAFLDCVKKYSVFGYNLKSIIRGELKQDLDNYPFPDRSIADMRSYSRKMYGEPVVSMLSSRGCKYRCMHCNSLVMGGGSRNVHYRSAENILSEINELRSEYRYFRFNDDHFTGNPDLKHLLERIKDQDLRFRAFGRLEDLDRKCCRLLAEAGCLHITLGLESLNPDNLKIIGKARQIGLEGNIETAKSFGITVRASFIVGLPFDDSKSIESCFMKAAATGVDEFAVYPLIPYPGTMLWKNPERYGYTITERDSGKYVQIGRGGQTCYALNHKNFSADDVRIWKERAEQILGQAGIRHMRESEVN
jgi:anaerobic magnesium-protoporphyrin IX monomethyl ester cyclase